MENEKEVLVSVKGLKKHFTVKNRQTLYAVDDVSFDVYEGETLGLVGESGCGKSTIGNLIMRLLPATAGELYYRGESVFSKENKRNMELRKKMQMIFQDPYSSLNPMKTIENILKEPYKVQKLYYGKKELKEKVEGLIDTVGLERSTLTKFPHELDGGRRQLVGIARALALGSDFIVCDEPVSALDVSMQATILNLLIDLQKQYNLSLLFISHDLSVVRHISNRIAVMYLGKIAEIADTDAIFENAYHPYTIALLSAVPVVSPEKHTGRIVLEGDVPSPINLGKGCRFAGRCWMATEECHMKQPELEEVEKGHCVACFRWRESRELLKNLKTN